MKFRQRLSRTSVVLMAGFAFAACGGPAGASEAPPATQVDSTLGAGDVFDVRVFGEKELSDTYRVSEDGTIDFPLVGRVEVAGLEPPAVADVLSARLKEGKYLKRPQVSVLVQEYNSKRFSVVGAVQKPGTFPMTSGVTVVQAISMAGGFTSLAARNDTVLTRRIDGELRKFRVPVEDVTEGTANDLPVQPGDIIYVPERLF